MSLPRILITKRCLICGKDFTDLRCLMKKRFLCSKSCQIKWLWKTKKLVHKTGHHLSKITKKKISDSLKGERHFNWKGNNASYGSIHDWLRLNLGKPNRCENSDCPGVSLNYDWAKKRGKRYHKNRLNYYMLCRSCHSKYDKNKNFNINTNY